MKAYLCMPRSEVGENAIRLTAVQPEQIEVIRQWRNAQMDVLRQSKAISPAEQEAYFAGTIWPDMEVLHPRQLLVSILEAGQLVGYGGLVHISWVDLRAEVSFLLDPQFISDDDRYRFLFTEYLRAIKLLAFRDLGFHRLFTETYAIRDLHVSILERSGFRLEGRLRNHVRVNERAVDSLLHGCLNDDER